MGDMGGMPLGSVEVEVKANLDKLVRGFAEGKAKSQQFQAGMVTVNRYAREMEQRQLAAAAATKALEQRQLATAAAMNAVTRATNPAIASTRIVSGALREAEKAYMAGSISATALARAQQKAAPWMAKTAAAADGSSRSMLVMARNVRFLYAAFGVQLVGAFAKFVIGTLESTAALKGQAAQLGLTTDQLQEYHGMARQVGMSSEDMDSAFEHLKATVAQVATGQVGPASKLFKALGVSITDAGGKAKSQDQIFLNLVDRLGKVGNEAQRSEALTIAFGEAGSKMGDLVARGADGVETLRQAVRDTGMVLSEEQIQKADVTAKKLDQVGNVLQAKWASTVVDNAEAIGKLADALSTLASAALQTMASIPRLFEYFESHLGTLLPLLNSFSPALATFATGFLALRSRIPDMATEIGQVGHSVTVKLPAATSAKKGGGGGNVDLSGLLSPKPHKGPREKFDQFDADMIREKQQQLQLEREATNDLQRQNEIDHKLIDLQLAEQIQQIKKQQHSGSLTASEAKQLIAAAQTTALMQKEAADRKMRVDAIERQAQYADEIAQLDQDALELARSLARTDEERKRIDLAILDSKQQQAVSEKQKEIALAQEAGDETRVAQLTDELAKLRANQVQELKAFDVEHLTGMDKFKNDLPRTADEFNDAIKSMKFDLFNKKLEQAAGFADDIGSAFGRAAGDLAQLHNPLDVLRNLVTDLAQTFTKNFIEKPITDWATQHIGIPAAKQAFGGDMEKMGLTSQQFDVALAQATGSLGALQAAAAPTSAGLGSITTASAPAATALATLTTAATSAAAALTAAAAAAGSKGASDGLGTILNIAGAAAGGGEGGGDMGMFNDLLGSTGDAGVDSLYGFALGGYTGSGAAGEVKGVVHANEFVMNAGAVGQYGLGLLGSLNSGSAATVGVGAGTGVGASAGPGADLSAAAAMLMQAAQMLMRAAGGGGGGKGGFLKGLLGVGLGFLLGGKSGAGSSLMGLFGGGGGGAGGGGIAALLGGLGGGTSLMPGGGGGGDLLGGNSALDALGAPGFASGGSGVFGGRAGHDRNVLSMNGKPFLRVSKGERFNVDSISSSRLASASRLGFDGAMRGMRGGDRHFHFGDIVVSGAKDDRSARQAGRQALSELQRGLGLVAKTGLNK